MIVIVLLRNVRKGLLPTARRVLRFQTRQVQSAAANVRVRSITRVLFSGEPCNSDDDCGPESGSYPSCQGNETTSKCNSLNKNHCEDNEDGRYVYDADLQNYIQCNWKDEKGGWRR